MRLQNQTAIVTGAGRGIGRATALALAREGAGVTLAARTAAEIEAVAGEIRALGREALAVPTDVADQAAMQAMVAHTIDRFGKVDILAQSVLATRTPPVPLSTSWPAPAQRVAEPCSPATEPIPESMLRPTICQRAVLLQGVAWIRPISSP